MTFGTFIEPYEQAHEVDALAAGLSASIASGYRAVGQIGALLGQSRIFDRIVAKLQALGLDYEDQCSAQYYFDLVRTLRDFNGEFDRVVEVGVFMGGSSTFLAGCIEPFDFDLDMVDIDPNFLRFAYERVRRMYPEAAKRIRLFHGDLPSYVRHVMLGEPDHRTIVHHDGSHEFNQVVKDMSSLYYVREQLFAIIAQDTHLRGTIQNMNFVDLALYAVFGTDLKYASIGAAYDRFDSLTQPNAFQGNYFLPGVAEGVVLPMAANHFQYPHPELSIDDFLPPAHACEVSLAA
ncbi:hypothetical protein E5A73_08140 [Sphingomonas gei]|uniref:Class I SAM-dependent methyltransferase n=1 Tax=Sphingomonas gei TaxID=1395960 RepID=A0A4S1XEM4_9SPHN|nr:class I SAM-dependent methyltransferase [Sphingomonas gei]TGX54083.1 hypothetical protein E5A73_08140 [Sphingomonas gei]